MAAPTAGACFSTGRWSSPPVRCCAALSDDRLKLHPAQIPTGRLFAVSSPSSSSQIVQQTAGEAASGKIHFLGNEKGSKGEGSAGSGSGVEAEAAEQHFNPYALAVRRPEMMPVEGKTLRDYFEEAKELIKSHRAGPPRWISPADCGSPPHNSPLFLYLPGIDGVGLGLIKHHHNLGKMFDTRCLHIPPKDRTSFRGLVQLVEKTVIDEYQRFPRRPIYLCGESLGACIALAVAARNPKIDLVLVLANPGTSFMNSQLRALMPLVELLPDNFHLNVPFMLGLMTGNSLKLFMDNVVRGLTLPRAIRGLTLPRATGGLDVDVLGMAEILPKETLIWKLQMLECASSYANARLQAVKARVLILSSGKDQLFPSKEESKRLRSTLPGSDIRAFDDNGHFLFLEDGPDLVSTIKGSMFYRRGRRYDHVSDFVPPTPLEFKKMHEKYRELVIATNPVSFSTTNDGEIVKGLGGIPSEGPVLIVGYHMLMGVEVYPMIIQMLLERNILLRGIAHPMMFSRVKDGNMPPLSAFDDFRMMGAAPVSGTHLFKLLSSKAHVLLYPGGMREACHRKGEQYKLFWPEKSEFIRMAARFGATIVPFGAVGEDDYGEVCFDYDDQMKIPFFRDIIEKTTMEIPQLRYDRSSLASYVAKQLTVVHQMC